MPRYDSDALDSDDLEEVFQMSMLSSKSQNGFAPQSARHPGQPGPSGQNINGNGTLIQKKQTLQQRKENIRGELRDVEEQIERLTNLRANLKAEFDDVVTRIQSLEKPVNASNRKGKRKAEAINYLDDLFDWTGELKLRLREVFGIENFRLCQEGVCNANMDGRDIVCVMPTGGGKSLTYQLPALLCPGCTLVISPLISLITDQILHLREVGVEAVMLTGSTPANEMREIYARLKSSVDGTLSSQVPEIKLCYVTPEKIAKSKSFKGVMEKLATGGKLARIVIDEAHCVSHMGHDFRPDYQKLNTLRQIFPRVPILALSATCPPKVLDDLVNTLRLNPVIDGKVANEDGTVYFTSPLYRKNLHYVVLPKPDSVKDSIKAMADYIVEKHKNDSGIVYCLRKKDADNVAEGLTKESGGLIRTGVYHSDIADTQKENLHKRWRAGEVKVVCATIAFGLGIDKGDVRFVLHHSISKSLDGYYQETGRAGRDGKDADCVLFYRPQDAATISAMVFDQLDGDSKLRDMLRFAQDLKECRKIQFARYLSVSSSLSMSVWETEEVGANDRCGHCDNCTRPPETFVERDVTMESWQVLRVAEHLTRMQSLVTLARLSDLVRGRKQSGGDNLDLDVLIGGKVCLSGRETEHLLVHLLIEQYLKETYKTNAYSTNMYMVAAPSAYRLTRQRREDIQSNRRRISLSFLKPQKKGTKRKRSDTASPNKGTEKHAEGETAVSAVEAGANGLPSSDDDHEFMPRSKLHRTRAISSSSDDSSDSDGGLWKTRMRPGFSLRDGSPRTPGSQRRRNGLTRLSTLNIPGIAKPEVIVLTDSD